MEAASIGEISQSESAPDRLITLPRVKRSRCPSGDQRSQNPLSGRAAILLAPVPSLLAIYSSRSFIYAISRPSGDQVAALANTFPTRWVAPFGSAKVHTGHERRWAKSVTSSSERFGKIPWISGVPKGVEKNDVSPPSVEMCASRGPLSDPSAR